jgi:hypothetical protein
MTKHPEEQAKKNAERRYMSCGEVDIHSSSGAATKENGNKETGIRINDDGGRLGRSMLLKLYKK